MATFGLALFLLRSDARPQQARARGGGPDLAPISGRVLSAANGQPVVGAIVHYRGQGGAGVNGAESNSPSLQGEVTTGPYGEYALPRLPFGYYSVRVSAAGYSPARKDIQTLPVDYNPGPPTPIPPPICMAETGKPTCGNLPEMPDGNFSLQPDPVHLQAMSDAALVAYAPPQLGGRDTFNATFTSDGNRLGFITRDRSGTANSMNLRCTVWIYDIADGSLAGVGLPGSPFVLQGKQMDDPFSLCPDYSTAWEGDNLYVYLVKSEPNPPYRPSVAQAYLFSKSSLTPVSLADLPAALQQKQAREAADAAADQTASNGDGNISLTTEDRKFTLEDQMCEGRCVCDTLLLIGPGSQKTTRLTDGCADHFILDRERDLLYYAEDPTSRSDWRNSHVKLVEYNLVTGARRSFNLPPPHNNPDDPNFLAEQPLPDGANRIAYSVHGDCDPSTSDYSQPGQPDGKLGQTPNQFSVCFVTIPPAPLNP